MGLRLAEDAPAPLTRATTEDARPPASARDLVAGLSRSPKVASPKWFYDAEGSRLFEDITRLPEYYPTRQEAALLRRVAPDWAGAFRRRRGPGRVRLGRQREDPHRARRRAGPRPPMSPSTSAPTRWTPRPRGIAEAYPGTEGRPAGRRLPASGALPAGIGQGRRVGFFPGSTIGNLEPDEAIAFLKAARAPAGRRRPVHPGRRSGQGSPQTLVAAYDDAAGVTAAFNRNLLVRANRELGADFDLDAFAHRAVWNADGSRMEMHLEATRDMAGPHRRPPRSPSGAARPSTPRARANSPRPRVRDLAEASRLDGGRRSRPSPDPSVALALLRGLNAKKAATGAVAALRSFESGRLPIRRRAASSRAPRAVGGLAALAAGLGGQAAVLGEAALLAGDAGAALAGDLALAFRVHRGEAPLGDAGGSGGLTLSHWRFLSWRRWRLRDEPPASASGSGSPRHRIANESQGLRRSALSRHRAASRRFAAARDPAGGTSSGVPAGSMSGSRACRAAVISG